MENIFSLYIHIPFCASLCDYCDFYSVKIDDISDQYIDKYLSALITDIKNQIDYFNISKIQTAYIGGGTPSVLGEKISFLLNELNSINCFKPLEFTVEVNPESLTENFLSICREKKVNRLSAGVQSFHDPSRKAVNRKADSSLVKERLAAANSFFSGNISADLIAGLPFSDEKTVLQDIKTLLDFDIQHISLYSLSVEDGTPLCQNIKNAFLKLPENEKAESLWLSGRDTLLDAGFLHYEVSNFAKPGKQCLHNCRYWRMENWIGAGASSSGTIIDEKTASAKRYTYCDDFNSFINKPFIENAACEVLDTKKLMQDFLLMGYRHCDGPDAARFKNIFGCGIEDCIPKTLLKWKDRDKMLFLNSFLADAFSELDSFQHRSF